MAQPEFKDHIFAWASFLRPVGAASDACCTLLHAPLMMPREKNCPICGRDLLRR
jgi:hypothetical protein